MSANDRRVVRRLNELVALLRQGDDDYNAFVATPPAQRDYEAFLRRCQAVLPVVDEFQTLTFSRVKPGRHHAERMQDWQRALHEQKSWRQLTETVGFDVARQLRERDNGAN